MPATQHLLLPVLTRLALITTRSKLRISITPAAGSADCSLIIRKPTPTPALARRMGLTVTMPAEGALLTAPILMDWRRKPRGIALARRTPAPCRTMTWAGIMVATGEITREHFLLAFTASIC